MGSCHYVCSPFRCLGQANLDLVTLASGYQSRFHSPDILRVCLIFTHNIAEDQPAWSIAISQCGLDSPASLLHWESWQAWSLRYGYILGYYQWKISNPWVCKAGGQYYWASILAPKSSTRFFSHVTGMYRYHSLIRYIQSWTKTQSKAQFASLLGLPFRLELSTRLEASSRTVSQWPIQATSPKGGMWR